MSEARTAGRLWLRALPTVLRVGASEAMAYRFEFLIWMLNNTMPLVMLALWSTVAAEAPFGRFGERDFVAYYLAALIVRTVTGSWVVWQINEEIRQGTLSLRLLRPIHPFVAYSGAHLSAIPMRSAIALPIVVFLLISQASDLLTHDPVVVAIFFVSLVGAWAITFFSMVAIGSLAFFVDKSVALFEVYLAVAALLSGYLIPLELLPSGLRAAAAYLPFKYMLAFPVEAITGVYDRADALAGLLSQWAFVGLVLACALGLWHAGLRRFEAYGA